MEVKKPSSELDISIIYKATNKYDFFLVPTANAAAGAVGFGLYGALSGFAAGVIDEILVSYGWTNGRYLSPIIQGASSFATLTSSWSIRGIGALLSFTFSRLATCEHNIYVDKIFYPTQMSIQAGYVFGWKGAVGGMLIGSIEEAFIHYKLYSEHYISTLTSFVSITHLLKEKTVSLVSYCTNKKFILLEKLNQNFPYILEGISGVVGLFKSIYEEKNENIITILDLQKNTGTIYKKLGKEAEYFDMLEKQVLISSGIAVVEQFIFFKLIGYFQEQNQGFYGQLANGDVWDDFKTASKKILMSLPIIILIQQVFIAPIESYFNFVSKDLLYNAIGEKWLVDEIPLKISQKEYTEVLIDNLNKDIEIVAGSGEKLRKSFFNGVAEAIYSSYLIYKQNGQDLIIFYQLYYSCTQYISELLSSWKTSYNNELRVLETKKQTIIKHDARNVETVVGRNGVSYSKLVLREINDDIRIIEAKQLLITHLLDTWKDFEKYMESMFSIFFIGYKARIGEVDSSEKLKLWMAAEKLSLLMCWRGKNAEKVEEVKNSINKLHYFIDTIEAIENTKDQPLYLEHHIEQQEQIIFENLCLTIGRLELFCTSNIVIGAGVYALTGDSGSGKSSLLSKVKGIKYNGITGSGVIKYPKNLNQNEDIALMPQIDFFPVDVTLLEAIYYPKQIPFAQRDQIYSEVVIMLQKLSLCNGVNSDQNTCDIREFMETTKDWNEVLSGGQKKKALLVSAFIHKPKILLLDEPFAGLDEDSSIKMQSFIQETLQDTSTIVVCIDHHASDKKEFYDSELYIENKELHLREFHSKPNNVFYNQKEEIGAAEYRFCPIEENMYQIFENTDNTCSM